MRKPTSTTASGNLNVNWSRLSDRGAWILANVEAPVAFERASYANVAKGLSLPVKSIPQMRRELRKEITRLVET